jgi:hypothetical protein
MRIEEGKFYRSRDGHKARIYSVEGGGQFPIHGALLETAGWVGHVWQNDGTFLRVEGSSRFDLVAEWVEQEPESSASLLIGKWVVFPTETRVYRDPERTLFGYSFTNYSKAFLIVKVFQAL